MKIKLKKNQIELEGEWIKYTRRTPKGKVLLTCFIKEPAAQDFIKMLHENVVLGYEAEEAGYLLPKQIYGKNTKKENNFKK